MMEGHQHGEGISSLVEEMLQLEDVISTLYADNRSAIGLPTTDSREQLEQDGLLITCLVSIWELMLSPRLLKDLKGRSSCSTCPKILRGLRGRAAPVVTKLIDAASALVPVATLGGADALLFAGLGEHL